MNNFRNFSFAVISAEKNEGYLLAISWFAGGENDYEYYDKEIKIDDESKLCRTIKGDSQNVVVFNKELAPVVVSRNTHFPGVYSFSIIDYEGGVWPVLQITTPDGLQIETVMDTQL